MEIKRTVRLCTNCYYHGPPVSNFTGIKPCNECVSNGGSLKWKPVPISLPVAGALAPGNLPERLLYRCLAEDPCGLPECARCNPEVEKEIVVCSECGKPEYAFYATGEYGWEQCHECGVRFCDACGPVLTDNGMGRRLCAICFQKG